MKTLVSLIVTLVVVVTLSFSLAQETGGFVQEDPHEHGAATLNVVLENDTLSMEFVSPAVNLVGFEYEPSSKEEMQAVEDALVQLEDASTLFATADAASCELTSAETEHVMTDEEGHEGEEHSEGEAQDEEESEEHSESGAEEHAEGEEHDEEEGAQHSEFHATYTFTCAQPDSLSSVALNELFALYPSIEDLDVQYVLPSGQGAAELSPTSNTELTF